VTTIYLRVYYYIVRAGIYGRDASLNVIPRQRYCYYIHTQLLYYYCILYIHIYIYIYCCGSGLRLQCSWLRRPSRFIPRMMVAQNIICGCGINNISNGTRAPISYFLWYLRDIYTTNPVENSGGRRNFRKKGHR